jgi:integrase
VQRESQPLLPWLLASVLYHAGVLPEPPATTLMGQRKGRADVAEAQLGFLRERWPRLHALAAQYVARRRTLVAPSTVAHDALTVGTFLRWLTRRAPDVATLADLDRRAHLEPYMRWVAEEAGPGRRRGESRWARGTQRGMLLGLHRFLDLVALWGWPDAPARTLLLPGDVPALPRPLPRAFDDVEAARMVREARQGASPLERLVVELLAGCGLRAGEAYALQLTDLVSFGGAGHPASQPWLRVPLGKLGNDRYVPVGPDLQAALDAFLAAERSSRDWEDLPSPPAWTRYLLAHKGRRVSTMYCNRIVHHFAARAGVADAHAHRWRHTFATQAINRGMDLATIATLLGHTTLEMTMLYARIANPTLRREFERVSGQVQAFYAVATADGPMPDAPATLPAGALGPAMTVARRELEWRRLGNGWCTRRAYLDCRYELICERCVHFNTDRLFLPVLEAQRADAVRKGQEARVDILRTVIAAVQATSEGQGVPAPEPRSDFSRPPAEPRPDDGLRRA